MSKDVPPASPDAGKPNKVAERDRVSIKEKIAYGCGGVGNGIAESADTRVMAPVFVVGQGVSPVTMSLIGLFTRAWDAITDALMGWVSDNTRTRWGRRRPYIFVGAFLHALALPLMFFFNPDWNINTVIAWIVIIALVQWTTHTIYNVPYQSLLYESSPDTNERTNVAAWRAYFGMGTQLLLAWVWWATQLPVFNNSLGEVDVLNGARWVMCILAVVVVILGIMPAIFMRERFYLRAQSQQRVGFKDNFKLTLQSKPFLWLLAFIALFSVGFNMKWGLEFYTKLYYVCGGDQELASKLTGLQGTLQVFVSLAGIPIFQWLANRIGKRQALTLIVMIVFGSSLSTFVLYTPAYPYLSILPTLLVSPAITAMWVIVPSLNGDVVDDDELNTGERREGAYSSIFSWAMKMSLSLATALSGFLVEFAGFSSDIRHNLPDSVLFNMRLMLTFGPAVLIALALIVLLRFPLTTERIQATRDQLEARRGVV
jgi:GPH family glycoside/pentoside/hexuronide:cation symporter